MKIFLLSILVFIFTLSTSAQTRQPSPPAKPFIVKTKQSVDDLERSLRTGNKVEDLIGGPGMQLRVAIQHDKFRDNPDAESHDESDDVYYVLDGTAQLSVISDPGYRNCFCTTGAGRDGDRDERLRGRSNGAANPAGSDRCANRGRRASPGW